MTETPVIISMDKQYETLDGDPVRIICVDGPNPDCPVIGSVEGSGCADFWTAEGEFYHAEVEGEYARLLKLVECVPRIQRKGYLNIFDDSKTTIFYASKELADKCHLIPNLENRSETLIRIACVEVEIDCREGDGL
ncbi:hypothetical protein [Kiloniella sp.]|uniref:hypothetical protein n=1 Tax=Kiloniella sp. TaxID=1938587 RepID=UPI003B013D33